MLTAMTSKVFISWSILLLLAFQEGAHVLQPFVASNCHINIVAAYNGPTSEVRCNLLSVPFYGKCRSGNVKHQPDVVAPAAQACLLVGFKMTQQGFAAIPADIHAWSICLKHNKPPCNADGCMRF